jgi:stage III sporulation protein SpoIIIAA
MNSSISFDNRSNLSGSTGGPASHKGASAEPSLPTAVDGSNDSSDSLKQVLEGLHRDQITQAHVQAMSQEQLDTLNKKEVQTLVSLLPKEYQDALIPYLLSLKQVQVGVDREVRARVRVSDKEGDKDTWLDILPGRKISRKEYDGIIKKVSLDPVSNRGSIQNPDNGNNIVPFHRISVAHSGPSTLMNKLKKGTQQAVESLQSAWASLRAARPYVQQPPELLEAVTNLVLEGKSVLVIGKPGSGKTTFSRAVAATVAEKKNVVMVEKDISNELGGNAVAPHPVLGKVLRMSIESGKTYEHTLREANANHGPDCIFTDEIKTKEHAEILSSSIADGVGVFATVHGKSITSVLQNPALDALTGGTQTITVGDSQARRTSSKQTIELRHTPPIDAVIVMQDSKTFLVYDNYREAADQILKGQMPKPDVYPVNQRESFDYENGTGEEPGIFSRQGIFSGRTSNGQVPSPRPVYVSPRQAKKQEQHERGARTNSVETAPVKTARQKRIEQNQLAAQHTQARLTRNEEKKAGKAGKRAGGTHRRR